MAPWPLDFLNRLTTWTFWLSALLTSWSHDLLSSSRNDFMAFFLTDLLTSWPSNLRTSLPLDSNIQNSRSLDWPSSWPPSYLWEMVVKVSSVHEIKDKAEFVWSMERVGHTHNKRTVMTFMHPYMYCTYKKMYCKV